MTKIPEHLIPELVEWLIEESDLGLDMIAEDSVMEEVLTDAFTAFNARVVLVR